jgi:hypothetical protein
MCQHYNITERRFEASEFEMITEAKCKDCGHTWIVVGHLEWIDFRKTNARFELARRLGIRAGGWM